MARSKKNGEPAPKIRHQVDAEVLLKIYEQRYSSYHFFIGFWFTAATFFFGGFSVLGTLTDWAVQKNPAIRDALKFLLISWPLLTLALALLSGPFTHRFVVKFVAVQRELGFAEQHLTRGGMLIVLWFYAVLLAVASLWFGIVVAKAI